MYTKERINQILNILNNKKQASVKELSALFNIGEVTIRRDLSKLEKLGFLQRTHGGAIISDNVSLEHSIKERENYRFEEKKRIGRFISQLIHNGETLMIDGGTTTYEVARMLRAKDNLMIVTNFPKIAYELINQKRHQVILTGGELIEKTDILVGPLAEHTISQFRFDLVILGMTALIPEEGFFVPGIRESNIKKVMIKSGKEIIVAMDSSKIGRLASCFISDLSAVNKLITDNDIIPKDLEKIEKYGVEVFTV
jgi:DeoR family fructose operon transcriptional repressor